MDRSSFRLIVNAAEAETDAAPPPRRAVALPALVILVVAAATTWLEADRARRPIESREIARRTILQAIELGAEDPAVRQAMQTLRRELGRRPMDAYTRAVYATFILGVSRGPGDAAAAAFHARRAARLAPVTVPVIRYTTHVLVRTGDAQGATALVREMFRYDPDAAATLLGEIEAMLPPGEAERTLIDTPEAWLAWWSELSQLARAEEAAALLRRARVRWPEDPELLRRAATRAHAERRWEDLRTLLPADGNLPRETGSARLFALRAAGRNDAGDRAGARSDAEAAVALDRNDPATLALAAETLLALGDADAARGHLHRALFLLPRDRANPLRLGIMVALARLEDREGSPSNALRTWRAVLEVQPEHDEARRRVDALAGYQR